MDDCSRMPKGLAYRWKHDRETRTCTKVAVSLKTEVSLAICMLCMIVGALLYLVLDDRFFCIKVSRAELAVASAEDVPKPTLVNSQKSTIVDKTGTEEEQLVK